MAKYKKSKRSGLSEPIRLLLTAGALLLGGLGAGLVIGLQIGSKVEPEPPPVRARAAPPIAPEARWPTLAPVPRGAESRPADARAVEPRAGEARAAVPPPAAVASEPAPAREDAATARVLGTLRPAPAPPTQHQLAAFVPPVLPAAPGGTPPWVRHAVPARPAAGRPLIAIVIDDMGVDRVRSARTIDLPAPLTLSFLPYAEDLQRQTALARRHGHELMVHVPMEPMGFENAGPGVLRTRQSLEDILQQLRGDLDRFDGFVGINNHMGSRFTSYPAGMAVVIAELRRRGLLWLDSRTTSSTVGMALAGDFRIPHVDRDTFLDHDPSGAAVRRQLVETEAIARRRGSAIAIGHPKDATIEALRTWLREAPGRGLAVVPLTRVVLARGGNPAD